MEPLVILIVFEPEGHAYRGICVLVEVVDGELGRSPSRAPLVYQSAHADEEVVLGV